MRQAESAGAARRLLPRPEKDRARARQVAARKRVRRKPGRGCGDRAGLEVSVTPRNEDYRMNDAVNGQGAGESQQPKPKMTEADAMAYIAMVRARRPSIEQ